MMATLSFNLKSSRALEELSRVSHNLGLSLGTMWELGARTVNFPSSVKSRLPPRGESGVALL